MATNRPSILMEEISDELQLAEAKAQRDQFDLNSGWLQAHASEIYSAYRGKCICIAGQELFVADTASEALALAMAVYPQDKGRFVQYIPRENVPRIYAY